MSYEVRCDRCQSVMPKHSEYIDKRDAPPRRVALTDINMVYIESFDICPPCAEWLRAEFGSKK